MSGANVVSMLVGFTNYTNYIAFVQNLGFVIFRSFQSSWDLTLQNSSTMAND